MTPDSPAKKAGVQQGDVIVSYDGMAIKGPRDMATDVANTISKIDMQMQQVVDVYPAPGGPDCMDVSADGRWIYVTARWARKLLVKADGTEIVLGVTIAYAVIFGVMSVMHALNSTSVPTT